MNYGVSFVVLTILVVVAAQEQCNEEKLSGCLKKLARYRDPDVEIPKTEDEVAASCGLIKNGSRCIRSFFNKCAPSVIKQMTNVAMAGVSRTINRNCSPKGIRLFLKHRDCVADSRASLQVCYKDLVTDVYRIKGATDKNKMHTMACCYISKFYDCNGVTIKKTCREESQEYYIGEATKLMDELMELFCPSSLRWASNDCEQATAGLPKPVMPPGNPSMLPLIIDMMKQFVNN